MSTASTTQSEASTDRHEDSRGYLRGLLFAVLTVAVLATTWLVPTASDAERTATATTPDPSGSSRNELVDTALADPDQLEVLAPIAPTNQTTTIGVLGADGALLPPTQVPQSEAVPELLCDAPGREDQPTQATTADSDNSQATGSPSAWYVDDFASLDPSWQVLAGAWTVDDVGRLTQTDAGGYDLIAELAMTLPAHYRIDVDLKSLGGSLGGGIMLAQPTPMTRNGAFVVDFTEGGAFVRWGDYDDATGQYTYLGGARIADEFDPNAAHRLSVERTETGTRVFVDDAQVGQFGVLPSGRVGLVTSLSAMAFDNFMITELDDDA